jgi:hypothetical protein
MLNATPSILSAAFLLLSIPADVLCRRCSSLLCNLFGQLPRRRGSRFAYAVITLYRWSGAGIRAAYWLADVRPTTSPFSLKSWAARSNASIKVARAFFLIVRPQNVAARIKTAMRGIVLSKVREPRFVD